MNATGLPLANLERALAIFGRLGDEGSTAIIYNNLGVVAREQGDDAHAADFQQRSCAMHRRLGLNAAVTLNHLGDLSLRHGDLSQAGAYLTDALRGGEPRAIALSLCRLARLATAMGQPEAAARLLGAANALHDQAGATLPPQYRQELARATGVARATLGEAHGNSRVENCNNRFCAAGPMAASSWILDYIRHYGEEAIGGIAVVDGLTRLGSDAALSVLTPELLNLLPGFFATDVEQSVRSLQSLLRLCFVRAPSSEDMYLMLDTTSRFHPMSARRCFHGRSAATTCFPDCASRC